MIKVSIIIPIYNVSAYIIRCIDSVINQTYQYIECILVDDCSSDDSMLLTEKRLEIYLGHIDFKVIHHTENRGLSAARNTGTTEAKGDYIYYFDSDDEILPLCIEHLVALVEKYPKVDVVQGNVQIIPTPAKEVDWWNMLYKGFPEYVIDNNWIIKHFDSLYVHLIPIPVWNKLIRREFMIDNELWFKEGIIHEDNLWMFWAVKKMHTIAFTTEYTYIQYHTHGSIMRSGDNYKSIGSWLVILKIVFEDFTHNGCYRFQKEKYLIQLAQQICRMDLATREKKLVAPYRKFVRRLIVKDIHIGNIKALPFLLCLLLPQFVCKSHIGTVLRNRCLKFI